MTSSAVTGDRRWGASARRGGMTVLGKVAVPKPINLPSQRLENHGLDPSVEIVPKGTLSWGSRPSSAGSNAWGTSALSPTTDGSSSSPRHLIGRPSSGGGSRPSTAGSEGAHDINVSAWGSNSRPSSASGILASNNASSTSLRPRSAETRPASSHLSRFAETATEGPGIRGATTAPERMGVASSTKEGFSLTSGDFPTLGSEKEESKRNVEPLEVASHGRPGSSGGVRMAIDSRGTAHGDDVSRNSDVKGNSWKKDNTSFVEDGPRPSMERWHGEPHMYPNPNMAPPHYESWRGAPPVNPPGGVWYRGPPGPPYGGPVPPGGFPMEPFPYYHPQVPAPGLANSQPIPPGAGHHGHPPKNGDMPHMTHVPHLHPGIPMRPGFYPVPYDGYYRPPMGFCNPNERDLPFMGMPPGPPVYTRHANQNAPDLINTHPRSREGRGPDQVEPCHPPDTRGQYKVLLSPNDAWNHDEEEKWGYRVSNSASASIHEKGILSKTPLQENAWEDDYKKDEDIHYGKSATIPVSSHSSDNIHASTNHSRGRFPEPLSNMDEAQINSSREHVTSPRDHSLIQKIEGLNAKARAAGGKQEDFHREEPNDRVQKVNAKGYQSSNEADSDVFLERHYPTGVLVPVSRNIDVSTVEKSQESAVASATAASRRSIRGAQIKGDPHAKGKFHGQEADERSKKSDSQFVLEGGSRSISKDQVQEHNAAIQNAEAPRTNVLGKVDMEPVMSGIDPSDMQRAKMREIAKQRAIQLQKEEEERVKEQKAKARAKLEELNRRSVSQGTGNPNQMENIPICGEVPKRQDVSKNLPEASVDLNHSTGPSTSSPSNVAQLNEKSASKIVDSAVGSSHVVAETQRNAYQEDSISSQNQLSPADICGDDAASHRPPPQVREVSKQKRGGYKQKQNVPSEKTSMQDAVPVARSDLKDLKVVSSTQEVTGSLVDAGVGKEQVELPVTAEFPHQKKKTNKSGKSRPKVEESPAAVSSSFTQPKDINAAQAILENSEQNGSGLYDNSISKSVDTKDAVQSENYSSSREGTNNRVNSAWKAQHSRKPRNPHGNRSSEKTYSNDAVVWAPVRSHNKLEVTDQTIQKNAEPLVSSAPGDNLVHNSSKTKRAEMERYVPKPVAKELAQQGSAQQTSSPSIDPAATDGSSGREKASHDSENVMKIGANMEPKHVDGKNKHPKAQGSWRQRGSAESTSVQTSQNSSAANSRLDESFVRGPLSRPDEWSEKGSQDNLADGWEIVNDSSSAFTGEKDRIPSGRGKRHPFKGHKGSESHQNLDQKDSKASLTDQFSHLEANQMEKTASSKENRAVGERSVSHWQPKPQGYVVHSQQGNRSRDGQNLTTEDRRALKSDTGPIASSHYQSRRNQSAAKDLIPASENKGAGEAIPSTEFQEAKQDKRVPPVKGHPYSPRREPEASAGEMEPASLGAVDGRNEQRPSSGYRKNANYGGRFNRGHESRGDWSSTAQENKQHYSSANRERQRQNSHYEYQPVGPYNGNNSRQNESLGQTESQSGASRFRERGQGNNSRRGRGNFYGRQSVKE